MRSLLAFLLLSAFALCAEDITVHTPTMQFIGQRTVNRRNAIPGSGVATVEKVRELGYTFTVALQNTSSNIVKLATGFNHIRFDAEPEKNQFVLRLSHRLLSMRPAGQKQKFLLILPMESFRIVTLRPGEGTLLSVTCWIPAGKVRSGDKLVIEYAPTNFGRYDFMQLKVRSKSVVLKLPTQTKKITPVVI